MPQETDQEAALVGVIQRLIERINQEATREHAATLLTAAYVLAGLRVSRDRVIQLFQGVRAMRDSTAYQAILDEGRAEEARKLLLRQGRKRFGVPNPATEAALQAVRDVERLERMSERLLEVSSWQDLLDTP